MKVIVLLILSISCGSTIPMGISPTAKRKLWCESSSSSGLSGSPVNTIIPEKKEPESEAVPRISGYLKTYLPQKIECFIPEIAESTTACTPEEFKEKQFDFQLFIEQLKNESDVFHAALFAYTRQLAKIPHFEEEHLIALKCDEQKKLKILEDALNTMECPSEKEIDSFIVRMQPHIVRLKAQYKKVMALELAHRIWQIKECSVLSKTL